MAGKQSQLSEFSSKLNNYCLDFSFANYRGKYLERRGELEEGGFLLLPNRRKEGGKLEQTVNLERYTPSVYLGMALTDFPSSQVGLGVRNFIQKSPV